MREPKRWECVNCGHVSNRLVKVRTESFEYAACNKCKGEIVESYNWLAWHDEQTTRQLQIIKDNGGYFMGVKVF